MIYNIEEIIKVKSYIFSIMLLLKNFNKNDIQQLDIFNYS
jgi:hypothetical protein